MKAGLRIGIIGGMGPLAGVELQRLIIEETPAESDQDHCEVLTYTNPAITDRTWSLAHDNGISFVSEVVRSGHLLEQAGCNLLAMSCMTAHARHDEITQSLKVPLINAVSLTCRALATQYGAKPIGLLATDGSIASRVWVDNEYGRNLTWRLPDAAEQTQVMKAIYDDIKAGRLEGRHLWPVVARMQDDGCELFVLGCTELGLLAHKFEACGLATIDPMREQARRLVALNQAARSETTRVRNFKNK